MTGKNILKIKVELSTTDSKFGSFGAGVAYGVNVDRENKEFELIGGEDDILFVTGKEMDSMQKDNVGTFSAKIPKGNQSGDLLYIVIGPVNQGQRYVYEWMD